MLDNYLRTALRHFVKYKGYSIINITGLAVGMACGILVFLYVIDEYSYDRFHDGADRTYRLVVDYDQEGGEIYESIAAPFALLQPLRDNYSDVEALTSFFWSQTYHFFRYEDRRFAEGNYYFADSSFFDVFTFSFALGDKKSAFSQRGSAVLTASTARKYFGEENPIGRTLVREAGNASFTVTGVIEDVPPQSHFDFDFLVTPPAGRWDGGTIPRYTYVRLREGANVLTLEAQLPSLAARVMGPDAEGEMSLALQPLTRIHLHSQRSFELGSNTDVRYIYTFSAIALLILVVACINFINLTTARSLRRAREVGVRKMMGARQSQLIRQFMGESMITTMMAFPWAILLVEQALPLFNEISGKAIDSAYLSTGSFWFACLALLSVVGVLSGSYPAFFLTSAKPVLVLKGQFGSRPQGKSLRNSLVMVQFSISMALIVGTLVIRAQMGYMQDKSLGFDQEQLIALKGGWAFQEDSRYDAFREALVKHVNIADATRLSLIPGDELLTEPIYSEGTTEPVYAVSVVAASNFADVLKVRLIEGRSFDKDLETDRTNSVVINRALADHLSWDSPIGKRLTVPRSAGDGSATESGPQTLSIIGVIEDVHFSSLHQAVQPMVFTLPLHYRAADRTIVRTRPAPVRQTLASLQETWTAFLPNRHLEYEFVDERLSRLYQAERRLSRLSDAFAFLSVFIACLGLFGLTAFTNEQRMKEVGVRKVLGASVSSIVLLLSRGIGGLVLTSCAIATPIIYLIAQRWLQTFAYQITLRWDIFAAATLAALLMAFLTVGYQAVRAAADDPVRALKHE